MNEIRSFETKDIAYFFTPVLVCMFLWGGGIALLYFALKGEIDQKNGNDGAMLVVGVGTILVGVYYVYSQITKSKKIFIDTEKVLIDKRLFFHEQIEKIYLTKKKPISILSFNHGTIIFRLKDGTEFITYDALYRNAREMKLFLEKHYAEVVDDYKPALSKIMLPDSFETFYTYKGNLLTSYRFYVSLLLFIVLLRSLETIMSLHLIAGLLFISLMLFFVAIVVRQFNFFKLSEQTLTVSNHFFFLKNERHYKITEIRNVIFEKNLQNADYLRIIKNDFKEVTFGAATLNKQDWIDLKTNLERVNIQVSVESVN